jgi:hypothetical protein
MPPNTCPRPNGDGGAVSSDAALPSSPVGDGGLDLGLWREESMGQWLRGYGVESVRLCSHHGTESCRVETERLNGPRRDVWHGRSTVTRITRLTLGSQQPVRAARGGGRVTGTRTRQVSDHGTNASVERSVADARGPVVSARVW